MNWLKRLLLYGVSREEEPIEEIYNELDDKLDKFEDLLDKVPPQNILLKAEPQEISDFAPNVKVTDFERTRPVFCPECGKELMFSNRYNYDAKTGQKFIIRVDADCPAEGADYAYMSIAKHAHFVWNGKSWVINHVSNYFGTSTMMQFTSSNVQVGTWGHSSVRGTKW